MNEQAMFVIATVACVMIGQHEVKEGKCAADVLRELKREVNKKRGPDKQFGIERYHGEADLVGRGFRVTYKLTSGFADTGDQVERVALERDPGSHPMHGDVHQRLFSRLVGNHQSAHKFERRSGDRDLVQC